MPAKKQSKPKTKRKKQGRKSFPSPRKRIRKALKHVNNLLDLTKSVKFDKRKGIYYFPLKTFGEIIEMCYGREKIGMELLHRLKVFSRPVYAQYYVFKNGKWQLTWISPNEVRSLIFSAYIEKKPLAYFRNYLRRAKRERIERAAKIH
jgi:hypothetical protein